MNTSIPVAFDNAFAWQRAKICLLPNGKQAAMQIIYSEEELLNTAGLSVDKFCAEFARTRKSNSKYSALDSRYNEAGIHYYAKAQEYSATCKTADKALIITSAFDLCKLTIEDRAMYNTMTNTIKDQHLQSSKNARSLCRIRFRYNGSICAA